MARRSTSWQWRRRRWATGWTRLPSCSQTALHTGNDSKDRYSGKPSGLHSFLASWRCGHSGIGTCWSSWSREAFGPRRGLRGSGARTTAASSNATNCQAPCSTAATSAQRCRQRDMHGLQELRQAASSLGTRYREQFAHGIFPDPGAILPTGSNERACPVLWHNRPPDGFSKCTFSRTALRRAAVRCDAPAGQLCR